MVRVPEEFREGSGKKRRKKRKKCPQQ